MTAISGRFEYPVGSGGFVDLATGRYVNAYAGNDSLSLTPPSGLSTASNYYTINLTNGQYLSAPEGSSFTTADGDLFVIEDMLYMVQKGTRVDLPLFHYTVVTERTGSVINSVVARVASVTKTSGPVTIPPNSAYVYVLASNSRAGTQYLIQVASV
jgi:hypothetical protein